MPSFLGTIVNGLDKARKETQNQQAVDSVVPVLSRRKSFFYERRPSLSSQSNDNQAFQDIIMKNKEAEDAAMKVSDFVFSREFLLRVERAVK